MSQEAVAQAVRSLRELRLGKAQTRLWRWLALKTWGLRPGEEPDFTSQSCKQFAEAWLKVNASRAGGRFYFQPFTGQWVMGEGRTDWAVQTLYTTLTSRPRQVEQGLWSPPVQLSHGHWEVRGTDEELYYDTLQRSYRHGIPLSALAIWRHRYTPFLLDTGEVELAQLTVDELHLSVREAEIVLSDISGLLEHVRFER